MKKIPVFFVTAFLVLCFGYAANAIHQTPEVDTKSVIPAADAGGLYNYITKPKSYTETMTLWPGRDKFTPSKGPHGPFTTTYVNKAASKAMEVASVMPEGAVIVHEEYDAKKNLASLSVLYKVKGYNPEAGDWFWAKYNALDGYVLESGKPSGCISCHQKGKDYLL